MMQTPQHRVNTGSSLPMSEVTAVMGRYNVGGDPYAAATGRTNIPVTPYSPPISQYPNTSTDTNSLSSRPSPIRSTSAAASHLSSASSMSRASDGTNYGTNYYSPTVSEFGRGPPSSSGGPPGSKPAIEETLQKHYNVLRRYLAPYLRAEAANNRTTKARDKLLRLSSTQFHELSTDVFDELLRREEDRKRPGGGVPPFLLPRNTFHPKRNQARQKLSTLPPDRFRQLATDVFYELERRIPRLATADLDRPGSSTGSIASSVRAPSRQGGLGGPPNGLRGPPPGANGYRGLPPNGVQSMHPRSASQSSSLHEEFVPPPRFDSRARSSSVAQGGGNGGGAPGLGPAPGHGNMGRLGGIGSASVDMGRAGGLGMGLGQGLGAGGVDMGRPTPQTFQSSTIVPNKSTMVEDDESDDDDVEDDDDASIINGKRSTTTSSDSGKTREQAIRIAELLERNQDLEERVQSTEAEVLTIKALHQELSTEKDVWMREKTEMESRLTVCQRSLENLHSELEQAHTEHSQSENELRANTERAVSDLQLEVEELRRENQQLRQQQQEASLAILTSTSNTSGATSEETQALQQELEAQRKLTEQVRQDSLQFLAEMRDLSAQSELAAEKEDNLHHRIQALENDNEHWRIRYAKVRTHVRGLKGASIGLGIQHESESMLKSRYQPNVHHATLVRSDGTGLVSDVDVTTYQLCIDDLLYSARTASSEAPLEKTKPVIRAVRAMVANVDGDMSTINSPTQSTTGPAGTTRSNSVMGGHQAGPQHPAALKARISRDANRLVTTARTHAISFGIVPVSLLDAAAMNLTASIVALLLVVGIKPAEHSDEEHRHLDLDETRSMISNSDFDHQHHHDGVRQSAQIAGLRLGGAANPNTNAHNSSVPTTPHANLNPNHHNNNNGAASNDDDSDSDSDIQPLQLQPRSFGDSQQQQHLKPTPNLPPPKPAFDECIESPVIKSGFVGRPQSPPSSQQKGQLQPEHNGMNINGLNIITSGQDKNAGSGTGAGATGGESLGGLGGEGGRGGGNGGGGGSGLLSGGWFNMLKSPASTTRGSFDSEDERFAFA